MRIAVCEGRRAGEQSVEQLLFRYSREARRSLAMTRYSKGRNLLYDLEEKAVFDVVFLEVESEELSGLELAQRLRQQGYRGEIVLVADSAVHAMAGYEVRAAGYLIRPVEYERLCRVMERLMPSEEELFYPVQRRAQTVRLPNGDILFVESDNAKCKLHCRDEAVQVVYKTLNTVEAELGDRRFLRCHQSYLVNMDYICRAEKWFELSTGDVVNIRQHGLKAARKAYAEYLASLRENQHPSQEAAEEKSG